MTKYPTFIAIDPGMSGAIAFCQGEDPIEVDVYKMPKSIIALSNFFAEERSDSCVVVEATGSYRPGTAGPGAVKFARHCGNIDMALVASFENPICISPQAWMAEFRGLFGVDWPSTPKKSSSKERDTIKRQRKNVIKQHVQAQLPHLRVTLANADALGLLLVLMQRFRLGKLTNFGKPL